jgi:predicted MFS family arabinose efflux permease
MVVPLFLGGIMTEFGVSEGTASFVPALEVGAIACAAVLFSTRGRGLDPRRAVWIALALVITGQTLSILAGSWSVFVASRAVAGFGEGVLVASANIQASLTRRPHRAFSLLLAVIITCFVVMASVIPAAIGSFGPRGAFAALLGLAVAAGIFLLRFPRRRPQTGDPRRTHWISGPGPRLLLAAVVVYVAFSAIWTYVGRIGASLGLSLGAVGVVISVCGVIGAFGPVSAGMVGLRWGRSLPLLTSLGLIVATSVMLTSARSTAVFAVSAIVIMMAFMFFVTNLRELMSALDPTGALVGLGVGVITTGGAAGPLFAGVILNAGGTYPSLGLMAVVCCAAAAAVVAPIARGVDRLAASRHHEVEAELG